jgi:SAM-dependent methyltransferase
VARALASRAGTLTASREHWQRHASNWAAWARTPEFDAYWEYSPAFFELVPAPGRRTLEVGCGEGRVTRDLVKRGHRVTGCDATHDLVRLAREADGASDYLRCDAASLPFEDGSFDLVVFYNSLMDIDGMEQSVREAARVLEPGGRMCACVTHPIPDAGTFESSEDDARFVITGAYLGERRWIELAPVARDGLSMVFAGWAYSFEGYFRALEAAGFAVEALREPAGSGRWLRIPLFLMWRAVKTGSGRAQGK